MDKALSGERVGIIIANTGTPDDPSPAAVKRYLRQFLGNERIVPMNRIAWKLILNAFVLPTRSVRSAAKYATIWDGGFAFMRDHRQLARKLAESYADEGRDVLVECAMSFGNPSLGSAMGKLAEAGCAQLLVLPLYPQHAFSQASIVADEVHAIASPTGWEGRYHVLGDYSALPAYLDAIADSIREAGFDAARDRLLLSFHSIPQRDIDAGDTYAETTAQTARAVCARLGLGSDTWRIGYQSRFDANRAWLGPSCGAVLEELVGQDFPGKLFVACPNFAVDCLETYHDILVEMSGQWARLREESGLGGRAAFEYVPCLGAADRHVGVLRAVLDGAMP